MTMAISSFRGEFYLGRWSGRPPRCDEYHCNSVITLSLTGSSLKMRRAQFEQGRSQEEGSALSATKETR